VAKSSSSKRNVPDKDNSTLFSDLNARYIQSNSYLQKKRDNWEENEKLFTGERADSSDDGGLITDGSLATLIIERSARNTSQLQTGRVKEQGGTAGACATIADLIYTHDIVPNANSGGTFQSKLYQVHQTGGLYGTAFAMYGLNVTDKNAFADWWIVKPQLAYPQPGKVTPIDMQWFQVETSVTVGQLKNIIKNDNTSWDIGAINKVIEKAKEGTVDAAASDTNKNSHGNRNNYDTSQIKGKGDNAPVRLRTEYQSGEEGKWITYAPDYDGAILRSTPNRHKNGKIPIASYNPLPLLDELYGLSDMDRGKAIQKTIDSFENLGYQNALLNTLPITKVKTGAVINSTLEMKPGATWRMDDLNAVQPYTTGNLSSDYFQNSISSLRSILLNQNGTTDTQQTSKSADSPLFGKTPQAIAAQGQRQNARDSLSLRMFDDFYGQLATGLLDVKLNCATKPVQLNLDKDTIAKLQSDEETAALIEVKGSMVQVNLGKLKSGSYKYEVDPGTSVEADDATEHQRLTEIINGFNSAAPLIQMAAAQGWEFNAGTLLKNWIASSGTKDQEEIIRKKTDEEIQQDQMQQQQMMQQQAMQGQPQDPSQMPQPGMDQMHPEQPMPEEAPQDPSQDIHPIAQAMIQDPEGFMQHIQGGGQ
jgi:hypothetical protein